jgi:hypothetical protein
MLLIYSKCGFLEYVSKYLEKTFYELAAVALHDCETYAKMRILAFHRYDMDLIDSRFPFMTIDQGLDVLSIMYGIPEFVCTYNYDINEQVCFSNTLIGLFLCVEHTQKNFLCRVRTSTTVCFRCLSKRIAKAVL